VASNELTCALLEVLERMQPDTRVLDGLQLSDFKVTMQGAIQGQLEWLLLTATALLKVTASFSARPGLSIVQHAIPLAEVRGVEFHANAKGVPGPDAQLHAKVHDLTVTIQIATPITLAAPESVTPEALMRFTSHLLEEVGARSGGLQAAETQQEKEQDHDR
jgi:hypothetical protein